MSGDHGGGLFAELLLIFAAAAAAVALCRPLRLPGTLGYFAAGAVLGPTALGLIDARETIQQLAEFGVVLLLFSLGLEFSLPRMLAMRRAVFGLGSVQVLVCGAVFAGALAHAGMAPGLALVIGGSLALSSTALVSRELVVTGQIHRRHGQNALGILLFQDLVAVGLLIGIPALAGAAEEQATRAIALMLAKGVGVFALLMAAGRFLLPPLFHEIARSRSDELFVLATLVVVMTSAWLTGRLGLSMALGGFVAGMMIGESRFRHQVEADIRPFRDVLMGIFLVTVGMMLDMPLLAEYWPRVLAFGVILMLIKGITIYGVARLLGERPRAALGTGIVLAEGGEFAFAVLALAAGQRLVGPEVQAFLVAVTLVSMIVTPWLVRRSDWLVERALGPTPQPVPGDAGPPPTAPVPGNVVLLGFGRVGQVIGRMLEDTGTPYVAVDRDPGRVADARMAGVPIHYGDAGRPNLLKALGVGEASLVVVGLDDPDAAERALRATRSLDPRVPVLVRTRDDADIDRLKAAGATEVVPETLESSLMLLSHVMLLLRRPRGEVERYLERIRSNRYQMLHGVFEGEAHRGYPEVVHPLRLPDGAHAVGHTAGELKATTPGVIWRGVRRQGRQLPAEDTLRLQGEDIVILCGPGPEIEAAEAKLLAG